MVLCTDQVKISKSLKKTLHKKPFKVTFDLAFSDANIPPEESTWIHPEMVTAYTELHRQGHAHSVECWQEDQLVGGLYGVAIGRVFFGESMFSLVRDSSKVALVTLCQHLIRWGVPLIDCQLYSEHLASMGAYEIKRSDFIAKMAEYCDLAPDENAWHSLSPI
ncbi:UNVERIFIED_CONTAM: hypothetical protein GTU68_061009 [Idotea baltica]|nr:hypothetical protein [Idotea baltica]